MSSWSRELEAERPEPVVSSTHPSPGRQTRAADAGVPTAAKERAARRKRSRETIGGDGTSKAGRRKSLSSKRRDMRYIPAVTQNFFAALGVMLPSGASNATN